MQPPYVFVSATAPRAPTMLFLLLAATLSASGVIPCVFVLPLPLKLSARPRCRILFVTPPTAVSEPFWCSDWPWCCVSLRKLVCQQPISAGQVPVLPHSSPPTIDRPFVPHITNSTLGEDADKPNLSSTISALTPIPTAGLPLPPAVMTGKASVIVDTDTHGLSASIWATAPDLPNSAPRRQYVPSRPALTARSPNLPRRDRETGTWAPAPPPEALVPLQRSIGRAYPERDEDAGRPGLSASMWANAPLDPSRPPHTGTYYRKRRGHGTENPGGSRWQRDGDLHLTS
ncbi:hypothetical protein DFH09DRAFT_1357621 [Mycena vulgaris]|nr:hypothetical protein DFH09DRAFT_1357621 [Mycena vulgaris]